MSNPYKLLYSNPLLGLKNGIYQDTSERFRDSQLSNYIQIAVADVFARVDDKSLFSIDLERACNTDELRAALSPGKFNFLSCLNLTAVNTVLDLSEDFGGVAHYLADQVGFVEALKIDPDLCRLSVSRCANKHNVCHISEDLEKLQFPSGHYDLIVLGQFAKLNIAQQDQAGFLQKLRAALSPRGKLILSTANSDNLGQWLNTENANDDLDIYHHPASSGQVLSHTRHQLRGLLLGAGFAANDFHASFSSDEQVPQLFSEDYLTASVNALNHFYRLGSIANSQVNEYLVYKNLQQQKKCLVDLASRFVVIAGTSSGDVRALYDNDFSYFPGRGRKPHWRTITYRPRSAPQVHKQAAYPEYQPPSESVLSQNLQPQPFFKGRILIDDWLQAVLQKDEKAFARLVQEYSDWLQEAAAQEDFQRTAYDLLPFNLILNERAGRRFERIDTEWQLNTEFSAEFVLFRALFWFAFENKSLLRGFAKESDIYSIGQFVVSYLPDVFQIKDLHVHVELEERVQAQVDQHFKANAVSNALLQSFESAASTDEQPLQLSAAWANRDGEVDSRQAVQVTWQRDTQGQQLQLSLPSYSDDRPILRIDPMSGAGALRLQQIELSDGNNQVIAQFEPSALDSAPISLHGLSLLEGTLLALNDDPYILIDLASQQSAHAISHLNIELSWLWGESYSAALTSMSHAVAEQNEAIIGQSHRLNQYRADIDYQQQRIDDLVGHRTDLAAMLKDQEHENVLIRRRLQHQIDTLSARLHAQTVRNDELHGYLLMRPSTRGKRVLRRWLNRLQGKPTEAPEPPQEVVEEVVESPLPSGELLGQNTEDYQLWIRENALSEADIEAAKADIAAMPHKPVFSILVPIYNTDPEYLLPMIESVRNQIYPHWQLCLVDDCSPKSYLKRILEHEALQDERISVQLNEVNQGISVTTNDALAMATGDYIGLLDHDDEISINALYENAKVINQHPEAGLIYSDEDKMDMQGGRLEPYFKPDYSPDLLDTNNYICHFTVIKKSILDEIGGFREGLDGSQDHDVILRAAHAAERVFHIPKILYHWRKIPGSTAVVYDAKSYAWEAGRKAVEDCLSKQESGVRVEFGTLKGTYRVFREIKGEPLVSIIIPFKDKPELLQACLDSILQRSSYTNFEIIGVSNNSEQAITHERMREYAAADARIRFVEKNVPFNFSEICNFGVEQAKGDYLVLLNNDIEIISTDWLERMLEHAQRESIGAVGGKLLYPDGRIQHAGVVVGMVGAAGHPHKFFPDNHIGYHGRLHMVYNVSAVTGAMMMMRTDKFKQVGGLDAENLAVAYNDIDLCLKLMNAGYTNLFTPHAKATHHESISRGYEDTDEKMQRLIKEQSYFLDKWSDFIEQGDPFYNPNLSLKNERFSLKFKD